MNFYVASIELNECRDQFLVEAMNRLEARHRVNDFTAERDGKIYPFIPVNEIDIDAFEFSTDSYIVI